MQRIGITGAPRLYWRQVPDGPPDVRRLRIDAPAVPEVRQAPRDQRSSGRDDNGALTTLRQAEVGEEVRGRRGGIAEPVEPSDKPAQMTAEPAGDDLAGVLDQYDVGPQQRGIVRDPPNQAIPPVVVQM